MTKRTQPMDSATEANEQQPLAEIAITDQQAAVIRAIVAGATQKAAAASVGVSEFTVSRWANSDPDYIAALNLARLDAWQEQRAAMAGLVDKARQALEYVMDGNDHGAMVRAAALVLGEFAQRPDGPVTVEDAKIALRERHRERWQREQAAYISLNDIILSSMM